MESEILIYQTEGGELNEDSVVRKYRTTAADGKAYSTSYYNLDVIISVGYRVKVIGAHNSKYGQHNELFLRNGDKGT